MFLDRAGDPDVWGSEGALIPGSEVWWTLKVIMRHTEVMLSGWCHMFAAFHTEKSVFTSAAWLSSKSPAAKLA